MDLQMATLGRGAPRNFLKFGALACFVLAAVVLIASLATSQGALL